MKAPIAEAVFTRVVRRMSQAIKPIDDDNASDLDNEQQIMQQDMEECKLQINSVEKTISLNFLYIFKCLLSFLGAGILLGILNLAVVFGLNVVNWVSVEQCAQILIVVC